ncbi:hypothetical protein ACFSJY_19210 [Thalassotalea euphylliae]|uniref:hypothetical protein n=1 Tax=Thalassotalea euphylliae TaxID=1655234 RepID=UPI0036384159
MRTQFTPKKKIKTERKINPHTGKPYAVKFSVMESNLNLLMETKPEDMSVSEWANTLLSQCFEN